MTLNGKSAFDCKERTWCACPLLNKSQCVRLPDGRRQTAGNSFRTRRHTCQRRTTGEGALRPGSPGPRTCLLSMRGVQCNTHHVMLRYRTACGVGCNPGELQIIMLSESSHWKKSTWRRDDSVHRKFQSMQTHPWEQKAGGCGRWTRWREAWP